MAGIVRRMAYTIIWVINFQEYEESLIITFKYFKLRFFVTDGH